MSAVPFIGSKISLVSKADLRYEGTLFTIDPVNSTVSLSNVLCFGTEDRLPEATPGSDTVYPFLIFKGADIKNLYVIEDVDPSAKSQLSPPNDPAIVGISAPAQSPNAAVIAAAKAKSDAEKAEKLLAQQMSRTSISGGGHIEPPPSHPAGYLPRSHPAGTFGYGYQTPGMFYAQTGAPPYNPTYSTMYQPQMPYSMHYPPNAFPADFSQAPPSNMPRGDFRQGVASISRFPPPPPHAQPQGYPQSRQMDPLGPNQPHHRIQNPVQLQAAAPAVSLPRSKPPSPASNDAYVGPGTAQYLQAQHTSSSNMEPRGDAVDSEFDFQSSNARFDKELFFRNFNSPRDATQPHVDPEASESSNQPLNPSQLVSKKYDKSASFFDDISLDRDERGRRENRRGQNMETFGTIAAGFAASNYRRNLNRSNRWGKSTHQPRRDESNDLAVDSPQSSIRRNGHQSPRPRSSTKSSSQGRGRRGPRRGSSNADRSARGQQTRSRNSKRSIRQPAGDSNATSV